MLKVSGYFSGTRYCYWWRFEALGQPHLRVDEADQGPRSVVINNSTVYRWKTQKPSALRITYSSEISVNFYQTPRHHSDVCYIISDVRFSSSCFPASTIFLNIWGVIEGSRACWAGGIFHWVPRLLALTLRTQFQREDWRRRVGRVAKGRARMDRPVVRVEEHNNDDLVQYLLSMKQ
jgi:hypothetical protein